MRQKKITTASNLIVIGDSNVGLDTEGPVNVKNVLIEGQHKDNQDEEGIEHGKKEHWLVPQLLESGGDNSLQMDPIDWPWFIEDLL